MATFPTLDDIKRALGIDPTDPSQDATLQAQLDAIVALVESYLGRGIKRANVVQEFDPPDTDNPALLLFRFPVESVSEVSVGGQVLGGWRLYKSPGILRWRGTCCVPQYYCCHEGPAIVVTYVGGYADDAWPADLLDAVMQAFYGRWNATNGSGNSAEIGTGGGAVRSVSVDGLAVQYDSATYAGKSFEGSVIPTELVSVAAALDPYRARFLTGV